MNGKFWADLDAARRAIEHATAGIDVSQMLTVAEAVKRLGPIDFKTLSSTLALAEHAQRQFERLTGNFDHVRGSIDKLIAQNNVALAEINPPLLKAGSYSLPEIPKVDFSATVFEHTRALDWARLNEMAAATLNSTTFHNLRDFDLGFARRLASLSDSYRGIFAGLPALEFSVPDFVTDLPPRDLILKTTIVSAREADFEPAESTIDFDDPACGRTDVALMLVELDAGYVVMLDEALEVIFGTTLGRARHAAVSLRELSMHVLHRLAPDDEVRAWSQDPNYYHNGRPTRHARILYICRFVNYGPYARYLKKSIAASLAFFDALNGLHEVRPEISDFQLRLMLTDAIGILRFLLRTSKYRP